MEQETLIFVDDKEKLEAGAAANTFANRETRNRAYINTLGAELALKYLDSENINVSNVRNIHSIKKILEEIDISDIMLENIHIDVRVVFDEKFIFIPKSHFEYNLVPDIYLVFNLAKDFSHVKFLGFFEPKLINKNNANSDYYFIEKEKLNSALDLKKYIENFEGSTNSDISDEANEKSEQIMISMADNDVSEDDKKYLLAQLTKNSSLRDKFYEYEMFETLSYKAMADDNIVKKEIIQPTFEPIDETVEEDIQENIEEIADEDILLETTDDVEENISDIETLEEEFNPEELIDLTQENFEETAQNDIEDVDNLISIENIEDETEEEDLQEDFSEETVSFENISEDLVIDNEEESISLDEDNTESFGNNLLENLAQENIEFSENFEEQIPELPSIEDTTDETNEDTTEDTDYGTIDIESTVEDLPSIDLIDENILEETVEEDEPEEITTEPAFEEVTSQDSVENYTEEELPAENIYEEPDEDIEQLPEISDELLNENSSEEIPQENIDDLLNLVDSVQDEISTEQPQDSELEVLFDESSENETDIKNLEETPIPGAALIKDEKKNIKFDKKTFIAAGVLAAVLAGFSITHFIKPKNENLEPISDMPSTDNNNILTANVPETPDIQTTQSAKELKNTAAAKPISESYLNVSKLVWDVPDTLSYSSKMQNYLRTAGKSIKLSLSADLLLATEYAYTNQVKVSLKLSKDGSVQDAKIVSGSGSTQIDNIVLQSVKDTLNVVKPPAGEIMTPDFNLSLIINF